MASRIYEVSGVTFERPSALSQVINLRNLLKVISIGSIFVIWAVLVKSKLYRFGFLPSPADVLVWGIEWFQNKVFWIDLVFTFARVWVGVIAACLVAIPMGLMIGWNKIFSDFTFPMVEILRPIPGIAYIPVAIMFLPWEEASTAFICFIGAFFPIIINTIIGVKSIDQSYFRAAKCLGSSPRQIFLHVVVPAALPYISAGAALGMGIGWMASVAGEMISGQFGLGYRIWESYTLIRYPLIVVGMIVIGILGLVSSSFIRYVTTVVVPWRKAMTQSLDESITKR